MACALLIKCHTRGYPAISERVLGTPFHSFLLLLYTLIHLYNMEDDREQRVDEAMIVEGNGDRERRESWKNLDVDGGGAGGGGGWIQAWRMMGS